MTVEVVDVPPPPIVVVDVPPAPFEIVDVTPAQVEMQTVIVGPPGPPGTAVVWDQPTPIATWTIPHTLGRLPLVALYLNGQTVDTELHATPTQVVAVWPYPVAGQAVLT